MRIIRVWEPKGLILLRELEHLSFNDGDTRSRPWWTPTPDVNHLLGKFNKNVLSDNKKIQQDKSDYWKQFISKRSVIPGLIKLFLWCSPMTLIGQAVDPKLAEFYHDGLNFYVGTLNLSYEDALSIIGGDPAEDGVDIIGLLNFGVLQSRTIHDLLAVDKRMRTFVVDKLEQGKQSIIIRSYNLALVTRIVSEPITWKSFLIRCILGSNNTNAILKKSKELQRLFLRSIRNSIIIVKLIRKELVNEKKYSEKKWTSLLSSLSLQNEKTGPGHEETGSEETGPGQFMQLLNSISLDKVAPTFATAIKEWSSKDVGEAIISARTETFQESINICNERANLFESFEKQAK